MINRQEMPDSVQQAFALTVENSPENIALIDGEKMLSYRELDERANYLAKHLGKIGVARGDTVALMMSRSLEMVTAMLAIIKCGAAYLPLDAKDPVSRTLFMLRSSGVNVLIAQQALADEIQNKCHVIVSGEEKQLFSSRLTDFIPCNNGRNDRMYIMFTSGSTGTPKGVVVPHRGVLRLVIEPNFIKISSDDVFLHMSSTSFDASTFEIWGALLNGSCLVIYPHEVFDPNHFKKLMLSHRVSIVWLTAALFHIVSEFFVEALAEVKVLLAGGDVINARNVNKLLNCIDDLVVINGYGPTENTTFSCCHPMTKANPPGERVPIGKPISGTDAYILDSQRAAVNDGQEGELYVGGDGVALGYLQEASNEGVFIAAPEIPGGVLYKTGDIVKKTENGELEFIGRTDNQIKIRGYRVSLDEIRENVVAISGVGDAVVLKKNTQSGDQTLVAYVRPDQHLLICGSELKEILSKRIPDYMIPDEFVINVDLPINKNGKLDKAKVQELFDSREVI